jgi:hypothetical protein
LSSVNYIRIAHLMAIASNNQIIVKEMLRATKIKLSQCP